MSIRTVLIWVVVVLVLAGATAVALRKPQAKAPTTMALLADPPSSVSAVRVKAGDWSAQFTRNADNTWSVKLPGGATWFGDRKTLDAFVRVLGQTSGDVLAGSWQSGKSVAELSVGARKRTIEFDDRLLGGAALARVTDGGETVLRVPANVPGLVGEAALRTWVAREAFPLGVADASELRIAQAEFAVKLKRTGKRWAILEPAPMPADQDEVEKLVTTLGKLAFTSVREQSDVPSGGLRIEAVSETRGVEGENVTRRVTTQELLVGPAESPGASSRIGSAAVHEGTEAAGPRVGGVLQATLIEGVQADPAAYVSKVASTIAKADIRRIAATPKNGPARICELGIDGWAMKDGAAAIRAAELIAFLSDEKAARVLLTAGFGGAELGADARIGTIAIGPDEAASQEIEVSVVGHQALPGLELPPGAKAIVLRTGVKGGTKAGGRTLVYTSPTALRHIGAVFGEELVK